MRRTWKPYQVRQRQDSKYPVLTVAQQLVLALSLLRSLQSTNVSERPICCIELS